MMNVTYTENDATGVAEIVVDGHVGTEDFDRIAPRMQAFIDRHGTIRLIEIVRRLDGFDASMMWKGARFDVQNLRHISHCAVVSDIGWMSPLTKAAGAFMSTRLRTFELGQIDAARAWIADPDGNG